MTGVFRLDGKAAIVTGAGRGLGREIAVALAREGTRVALVARSAPEVEETAGSIRSLGGKALALPLDVTESGAAARAAAATKERFGTLDILVAAAGIAVTRPSLDLSMEEWDRVINVNLRAAFEWSQAAAREMAAAGGGRIIHVASVVGQTGMSRVAAYSASKGGMIALTRSLATEWAHLGITVNAIAPGYVRTALNEEALSDQRVMEAILRRTPMRRLGRTEEVAAGAVFLASEAASFITGHVLAVDGGWLAS